MTLDELRKVALSFPGTTEAPHFHYSSFRVQGKIFATVPPPAENRVHVFVGEEERQRALQVHADECEVLTWGQKVIGLRIVLSKARVGWMRPLLAEAWRAKAPKSLVKER